MHVAEDIVVDAVGTVLPRHSKVLAIFFLFLWVNTAQGSCPVCTGGTGLALKGAFLTTLNVWDIDLRERADIQETGSAFMRGNDIRLTSFYTFSQAPLSLGLQVPYRYVEWKTRDGVSKKEQGLYGGDVFARYFIYRAPYIESRPVLSLLLGLGMLGGLPDPWTGGVGIGGSLIPWTNTIFYGSANYSSNLSGPGFGNRFFSEAGLVLSLFSLFGAGIEARGDVLRPDRRVQALNVGRDVVSLGPRVSWTTGVTRKISVDVLVRFPLYERLYDDQGLPSRLVIEAGVSAGL